MQTPAQVPDEILTKLRRLLALTVARGATEHEAAVAMKMANKLMEQFGLSHAEVEMDGEKTRPDQVQERRTSARAGMMPWEKTLPMVISCLMAVRAILDLPSGGPYAIRFFGLPSDAAMAREVFEILRKEIWGLSDIEGSGAERRSFCEGCVHVLLRRASELKKQREGAEKTSRQTGGTVDAGRALVVVKQNQIAEIVKNRVKTRPTVMHGSSTFNGSYQRGAEAGSKINLHFGPSLGHKQ